MNPYIEVLLLTVFFTFLFFYFNVQSLPSIKHTLVLHLSALVAALLISQGILWILRK